MQHIVFYNLTFNALIICQIFTIKFATLKPVKFQQCKQMLAEILISILSRLTLAMQNMSNNLSQRVI
jgi:hypothetical protein